jgi:DNA-binding response OmpR family regulator
MPGMNGKILADEIQKLRPGIQVLFISGYTENVIAHRGILDPGVEFMPKPFTPAQLLARIQEILKSQ